MLFRSAEWKQRDFYQMAAFFGATSGKDNAILGAVNKAARGDNALPKVAVRKIAEMNAFRLEDQNKQKLTFPATIEYEYKSDRPAVEEVRRCVEYAKAALA